jgi:hypothetical protein
MPMSAALTSGQVTTAPGDAGAQVNDDARATLESKFVEELSERGLLPDVAERLLRSMPCERLTTVGEYIDYWDEAKRTGRVGEGFLYRLIQAGKPLPSNFETSQQRIERQTQQREIEGLRQKLVAEMRLSTSGGAARQPLAEQPEKNHNEPASPVSPEIQIGG